MVTFELPVFVMVTLCEGEDVPVLTLPKLRLAGLTLRVAEAAIPVPLRPMEVGELGALLTMEMLPDAAPTEVGRKDTVKVVCCPAFTLKGRGNPLTVRAVEPDLVNCVIFKVAAPVLVTIKT